MNNDPAISIIVINRNYARYIRGALDSVAAQTFRDFECIVVDDASDDDSVGIICEYVRCDKRFSMIRHESKRGPGAARNAGLRAARGKYVMFLDSDDAYTRTAAAVLHGLAETHDLEVVAGGVKTVNDDFKFVPFDVRRREPPAGFYIHENTFDNFTRELTMRADEIKLGWVWCKIYRKSALENHWFPEDFDNSEDVCWTFVLMAGVKKIARTESTVAYHRRWPDSITRKGVMVQDWSYLARQLDFMEKHVWPLYPPAFRDFCRRNMAEFVFFHVVIESWRSCNREQMAILAARLRSFYDHPSRPVRALSLRKRIRFWLFMLLRSQDSD